MIEMFEKLWEDEPSAEPYLPGLAILEEILLTAERSVGNKGRSKTLLYKANYDLKFVFMEAVKKDNNTDSKTY